MRHRMSELIVLTTGENIGRFRAQASTVGTAVADVSTSGPSGRARARVGSVRPTYRDHKKIACRPDSAPPGFRHACCPPATSPHLLGQGEQTSGDQGPPLAGQDMARFGAFDTTPAMAGPRVGSPLADLPIDVESNRAARWSTHG